MDILNYFPSYPSIHDETFYQEIFEKKEFHDLSDSENLSNVYTNHQLFVARFLSPWTRDNYHSLLLIHDTGTGKSASVAAVLNGLKKFDNNIKMLYLTNNETLESNFKKELLKRCPYLQERRKNYDRPEKSFFKSEQIFFNTFSSFANEISKMSSKYIILKKYINYFIVLDEAHHLVSESLNVYRTIYDFLQLIPEKRLCVMTATPMRDNLLEAVYLLNLVLPPEKNLPTEDTFVKKFFKTENNKNLEKFSVEKLENFDWKNAQVRNEFLDTIKGYVSVFRQKSDNVKIVFQGNVIAPMVYVPVFQNYFDPFQQDAYMKAFSTDVKDPSELGGDIDGQNEKYSNFYSNSVQASLMVFPNGSWGTKNTSKYFVNNDRFSIDFSKESGISRHLSPQENLKQVKKYSVIYYNVISALLDPENQNKCFYVYCEKINGSGILRLINLLVQYFSFSLVNSESLDWNSKRNRCIFLNEKEGVKVNIMKQLDIFNDPRNRFGEYVRVIFGTDKTREGITLKNIQKIHVLTPGWNFGKKNQALGRGIRLYSHRDLENPEVDIYLHCSIAKQQPLYRSVNYLQYLRSEIKEKNIFLFSYAFLISAIDCQINKYNNVKHAEDYSSDCFFKPCQYHCRGITKQNVKHLDQGNFNTFYYSDEIPKVVNHILEWIRQDHVYTFFWGEIQEHLLSEKWNQFLIFQALQKIIEQPIPIFKFDGTLLFLNQDMDYFYTSTSQFKTSFHEGYLAGEQERDQRFWPQVDIIDLQNEMFFHKDMLQEKITMLQELLKDATKKEAAKHFFDLFPVSVQEIVLMFLPVEHLDHLGTVEKINDHTFILRIMPHAFRIEVDNNQVEKKVSFYTEKISVKNNNKKITKDIEENLLLDNPFGVYAIVKSPNDYKIRDISSEVKKGKTKSKTLGQNCSSVLLEKIYYYIILLSEINNDVAFQKLKTEWFEISTFSKKQEELSKYSQMTEDEILDYYETILKKSEDKKDFSNYEKMMMVLFKFVPVKRNIACGYLLRLFKEQNLVLNLT